MVVNEPMVALTNLRSVDNWEATSDICFGCIHELLRKYVQRTNLLVGVRETFA